MASQRGGETVDSLVASLAMAFGTGHLKAGTPCRGVRIGKHGQLRPIKEALSGAAADDYDGRPPCQVGESFMVLLYDRQIPRLGMQALYDFINGYYLASGMTNEEKTQVESGFTTSSIDCRPTALRSAGIR